MKTTRRIPRRQQRVPATGPQWMFTRHRKRSAWAVAREEMAISDALDEARWELHAVPQKLVAYLEEARA
jgi:hypothetical protein